MFNEKIKRKNTNCAKYDGANTVFNATIKYPLWVADMDFKAPKNILNALKKRSSHGVFGYEFLSDNFYQSVTKRYENCKLDKENIAYFCGVVSALFVAVKSFSKLGEEVIIQPPVYFPFFSIVKNAQRRLVLNPLKKTSAGYEMDFEDLKQKISPKTRLLILCSPANPVGRIWSKNELKTLDEITKKHNILVLSDEIHSDLSYEKFTSFLEINKNAICFDSPSKAYNLAGLNAAFGVSGDAQKIKTISQTYKSMFFPSPNNFGVTALTKAYENKTWLLDLKHYLKQNIILATDMLSSTKIKFLAPQATYLLWLDFRAFKASHLKIKKTMLDLGLGLNDGTTFDKNHKKFFRLNVATRYKFLQKALKKLQELDKTLS